MSQTRSPDPLFAGARQGGQRGGYVRAGSDGRAVGSPITDPASNQSRAERFEDEKRRIIESCFSKKDADGLQLESYITHIRIIEDAVYPSSPPPPDSGQANKKSRVILISVRKSGRVKVHKARENPTGSFSIGKTWNLDDLSAIQSYNGLVFSTLQEQEQKLWASDVGFVVTLGKPYYWQASTSKEKDFFIGSLIKIFRKYTGGNLPGLIGFTPQEIAQFTGPPGSRTTSDNYNQSPTPKIPSTPALPTSAISNQSSSPIYSSALNNVSGQVQDHDSLRAAARSPYRPQAANSQSPSVSEDYHPPSLPEFRTSDRDRPPTSGQSGFGQKPPPPLQVHTPKSSQQLSPQPSFSSLNPSISNSDGRQHRVNGSSSGNLVPNGLSIPKLFTAPSESSYSHRTETEASTASRPGTATSNLRIPNLSSERQPPPDDKSSDLMVPPPLRSGLSFGQRSVHSDVSDKFATPLGTPPVPKIEAQGGSSAGEGSKREPNTTSTRGPDYFAGISYGSNPEIDGDRARTAIDDGGNAGQPVAAVPALPDGPPTTEVPEQIQNESKAEEEHRPGLGPMVKKKSAKDVANTFRRAALAATAFQPRAGGAGARLKAQQETQSDEPDGITGVVPAPLFRGISSDSAKTGTPDSLPPTTERVRAFTPLSEVGTPRVHLQRSATDDSTKTSTGGDVTRNGQAVSPERPRSRSPGRKRRQKQEADIERYCAALGIDPRILEGRGGDFCDLLTEFGWDGRLAEDKRMDDFEADLRREIGRAQATGWLGHIEQQESKIQELSNAFDKAIEECEEMDGLLTLYAHELDTLRDDIQYIEAQSQGLQVQTANQKLLQKELQGLLQTLTISPTDLRGLRSGSLGTSEGIQTVEQSLSVLYKAMITIDPNIRQNRIRQSEATGIDRNGVGVYADTEIGQMRAVRERAEEYREETNQFLARFSRHMISKFRNAEQRNSRDNNRSPSPLSTACPDLKSPTTSRQEIWIYNALMLFVRERDTHEWTTLIRSYELNLKTAYQEQFRDNVVARKRTARLPAAEDHEMLFTAQDKEKTEEGTGLGSRKLTVKRGKTIKSNAARGSLERHDGKPDAWEAFDKILQQQSKVISEEQNFILHFFHLNSQVNIDFAEIVISYPPQERHLPNLSSKQSYDPDRKMAKILEEATESIFSFWPADMQGVANWAIQSDQLQGVGVLCSVEQCLSVYEETNQEYITRELRKIHDRMNVLFHRFVDEQVKAIEETKVKIKKRKGIISFMRTFPLFSAAVESMIPGNLPQHDSLEIRFIVDDAYNKILKAMWESLNFIAKDDPASGPHSNAPTSGDPEDKEALNYHILLIENMNFYHNEVETHQNIVLLEWKEKAKHDMFSHLSQYTDAVIRRPLGKWLDFLESTEAHMKSDTLSSYTSISSRPSHSRSQAKKLLSSYESKEIRKGVETLKKRIEKHFGDVEDAAGASSIGSGKSLITRVYEECNARYAQAHERMGVVLHRVYDNDLHIDWKKEEVAAIFKR